MQRSPTAAAPASTEKHTPGPWKVTATDPAGKSEWFDIHADRPKRQDCHYIGAVNGPQNDVQRANARLIAAAPDYDTAAREIDRQAGQMDAHLKTPVLISFDAIMALRAAIARAEGRS
ncbi:MAG: hypothetical protein ACOZAM_15245 [Pseudomonadota bacterium]